MPPANTGRVQGGKGKGGTGGVTNIQRSKPPTKPEKQLARASQSYVSKLPKLSSKADLLNVTTEEKQDTNGALEAEFKERETKPKLRVRGNLREALETKDEGFDYQSSDDNETERRVEQSPPKWDSGCETSRRGSLSSGDRSSSNSSLGQTEPETPEMVGFGMLPSQVCRKAVRKGFEFSLMVVGESGLGKSTLVNSMFLADIYKEKDIEEISLEMQNSDTQTLKVETHTTLLEENNVKLALTVIDTPGYGDLVDNTDCWVPIIDYIQEQFEEYLEQETRVDRGEIVDRRVHACLYFIAPRGHGLKPLDVDFMKRIHDKVNIIPVIGKSDTCTAKEIRAFKAKILGQLSSHCIQVYNFPESELEDEDLWMRELQPFAVVGSNVVLTDQDSGQRFRGRQYPWGTVNIESKAHCDFTALRSLLLAHHMHDLREMTHARHYQNFRCKKLTDMMRNMVAQEEELEMANEEPSEEEDVVNDERTWEDVSQHLMELKEGKNQKTMNKLLSLSLKDLKLPEGGKMRGMMKTMKKIKK